MRCHVPVSSPIMARLAPTPSGSAHFQNEALSSPPLQQLPQLPDATMFLQRSAVAVARHAAMAPALRRSLATSAVRRESAGPENRQLPRKISQAGTELRSLPFPTPGSAAPPRGPN